MAKPEKVASQNVIRAIPQAALTELLKLDEQIVATQRALKTLTEQRDTGAAYVEGLIERGLPTEPGTYKHDFKITSRVTPKWKEEFARVAGPEAVEQVQRDTPASVTRKLIVLRNVEQA